MRPPSGKSSKEFWEKVMLWTQARPGACMFGWCWALVSSSESNQATVGQWPVISWHLYTISLGLHIQTTIWKEPGTRKKQTLILLAPLRGLETRSAGDFSLCCYSWVWWSRLTWNSELAQSGTIEKKTGQLTDYCFKRLTALLDG